MFGGADGGFNPDILSGRLEEMLPVIQQVVVVVVVVVVIQQVVVVVGLL